MKPDTSSPCPRRGCDRNVPESSRFKTCSPTCGILVRYAQETDRIAATIGPGEARDEIREATTNVYAAFDALIAVRRHLRQEANRAGISTTAWLAIVRGETQ
jgi:hypothetical protein